MSNVDLYWFINYIIIDCYIICVKFECWNDNINMWDEVVSFCFKIK